MNRIKDETYPDSESSVKHVHVHPLTLSFKDDHAHLEEEYRKTAYSNLKYLSEIRVVLLLSALVYALFGILDVLIAPDAYGSIWIIRFGVYIPCCLAVILLSFTRMFQRNMQFLFAFIAGIGGGGIILMTVLIPPPANNSYYAGLIIVLMFLYCFGRVRFIWATLTGWVLVLLYEISAFHIVSLDIHQLINNNFFFICANIIGMASCYIIELYDRKNYYFTIQFENERRKAIEINEELESRVIERTSRLNNLNSDFMVEIEQRKKIEKELLIIKDELELRVEERTAELRQMNKELEEAKEAADASAQYKSEFLANMSHEIRTPMNAILGMADLVMNPRLGRKQRNDYLKIIRTSARSLLGIINDILDLSKIEAGKLEFEIKTFNIREHVEGVTDMFIQIVHSKGIQLIVDIATDIPLFIRGDALRLQQVLINLISNALKFTDRGEICVRVNKGTETDTSVELIFDVEDTGIGIDRDKQKVLFDAFAQADGSVTRKYGGTGLGLAICKRIVSIMGGDIHVESRFGEGSNFRFNVMLERHDDHVGIPEKHGKRDTIIDDVFVAVVIENNNLCHMISQMLNHFGIRYRACGRVSDALEQYGKQITDYGNTILLMDEATVLHNDLEIIRQYKNDHQKNKGFFVIMTSSLKTQGEVGNLHAHGVDGILVKPVKSSNLFDLIITLVRGDKIKYDHPEDMESTNGIYKGMKVLLVEDNLINQMVAVEILAHEGISVDRSSNGSEAIDMVRKHSYDLVLMDVQMPEMDGIEATRYIREHLGISSETLPVIAMTAHVMRGDRERCIEAGMDDFISKPIEKHKLFDVIHHFYSKRN